MYPGNRTPWNILIKITGDHAAAFDRIAGVYSRLHPDGAFDASFIEDQIADTFSKYTQLQKIIIIFTVIAIFVSSLGLFAMSTYYIRARSRNIAVEKVFGADKGLILRQIASSYLLLSLIAFVVSVPVSWSLSLPPECSPAASPSSPSSTRASWPSILLRSSRCARKTDYFFRLTVCFSFRTAKFSSMEVSVSLTHFTASGGYARDCRRRRCVAGRCG